jgi:PAS domain S-box-containing protein
MKPLRAFLDDGLDELAVSSRAGLVPRLAANVAVAVVFTFVISWRLCLAWACVTLALEGQVWFATRPQVRGLAVGWGRRLWHVGGLTAASLAWVGLGALAWTSGSVEGALCAVVIWLAVIFFAQTNAYQSPLGFVAGGAIPAVAVMAVVLLGPHAPQLRLAPFVAMLAMGFAYAGEGVGRMLRARRRHAETQAKMRQSEALYRMLADNVTDVISLSDVAGRRIYMSPSIERALGYSVEALQHMPTYSYVYPPDVAELRAKSVAMARSGGQMTAEYRVVRGDGTVVWVETTFAMAPPEKPGGPAQIVSVARNIQQRKAMEAELIEARRAAEAGAAAKSDFLANMTHELRTPLNAIIGFAAILNESPRLDSQDARHARLIREASVTLLDLVNSVLDFSRLEAGAVELEAAPFDPVAEGAAIIDLLADQAAAKGLTLTLNAERLGLLNGDARRLRQVLLNFLSNAIKFTAEGGVTLTLTETAAAGEPEKARLRAEISDTGVGIAHDQLAHVFERFTQADASVSRRYGGTGLGLTICKRIVELMGGEIGATSVEGEGATFWCEVTLPRAAALAAPAETALAAEIERPLRLLLVEDVAINRELVRTVLAPFDIEIDAAEDGAEAIEAFRRGVYDLVLMDVQMPGMDGLTATRHIRALPLARAATTPIVAMTANVLPDQIARCLEAGMDGHLGKPMNPGELLGAISYWTSRPRFAPAGAAIARSA